MIADHERRATHGSALRGEVARHGMPLPRRLGDRRRSPPGDSRIRARPRIRRVDLGSGRSVAVRPAFPFRVRQAARRGASVAPVVAGRMPVDRDASGRFGGILSRARASRGEPYRVSRCGDAGGLWPRDFRVEGRPRGLARAGISRKIHRHLVPRPQAAARGGRGGGGHARGLRGGRAGDRIPGRHDDGRRPRRRFPLVAVRARAAGGRPGAARRACLRAGREGGVGRRRDLHAAFLASAVFLRPRGARRLRPGGDGLRRQARGGGGGAAMDRGNRGRIPGRGRGE